MDVRAGDRRGRALAAASLAALAALAACGRGAIVHHPGTGYVSAIELHGNHAIDDDILTEGLALSRALAAGRDVDPYELSVDARRIEGAYQRRGFFGVAVGTAVRRRGDAATAVFTIDEGPRARLVRVEISGAPDDAPVAAADLRALIPTGDGEPFDYDAYDDAKPRLLAALEDAGYARAHVDARVIADRVHHEAVIQIVVDAGPRCRFGEVRLVGVDGALADAARARLAVRPGAAYSNAAVVASQDALYDMHRFATVRVEPDRSGDDATVPVTVSVVEAARHELRVGVGLGIDPRAYLVRPSAGYSVTGWPWTLTSFDADLRPAVAMTHDLGPPELRLEAIASLTRIDLFRPRVTGELSVAAQYLTVEAYTSVGQRLRLGLSTPLGIPQVRLHAGWQLWTLGFVNIASAIDDATRARLGVERLERVAVFDQGVTVDLRDDPLEPRRGAYAAIRVAEGVPLVIGDDRYLQIAPDLRAYLPIGPIVAAAHARAGVIAGDVPPTERYFSGGASTQRGFPERQLSPSASRVVDGRVQSVVIGGAGVIETGVELRATAAHLRGWPLELAVFLDGADVTDAAGDLDPMHLHWAAGGGARLVTPYGPIRIDLGYRLNRTGAGEPLAGERFAYQLGFGEAY
jgi:translocation and assembly module TamA